MDTKLKKWFAVQFGCSESWRSMVPHSSNLDDFTLAGSEISKTEGKPPKKIEKLTAIVVIL